MRARVAAVGGSIAVLLLLLLASTHNETPVTADAVATTPAAASVVARGKYMADAANCRSCHSRPNGAPFSGGVAFETPFGTIYSSNITPDRSTGIGTWSAEDLRRAMHEGVGKSGRRLFPAFPYTSFTKMTDADVEAIYAYLQSLKPVHYSPPANDLAFSQRWAMRFWNALFFEGRRYEPDPSQSDEWNRGAYLVEGPAHCGACHSPRNSFMAEMSDRALEGGTLFDRVADGKVRRWSAVNLTAAKSALASWSVDDLSKYLHSGFSPRGATFGPMNEVIVNSLMQLSAADIRAIAVYIKSLPPREQRIVGALAEQTSAGESIYMDRCAKCHGKSGRGGMFSGPPLAGSAIAQADDPASLINVLLYGPAKPESVATGAWEDMPSYGELLDDAQLIAVGNYIRASWGNRGRALVSEDIARQR